MKTQTITSNHTAVTSDLMNAIVEQMEQEQACDCGEPYGYEDDASEYCEENELCWEDRDSE